MYRLPSASSLPPSELPHNRIHQPEAATASGVKDGHAPSTPSAQPAKRWVANTSSTLAGAGNAKPSESWSAHGRARTRAINHLKALIVSAPGALRAELRGMTSDNQITYCASLRLRPSRDLEHRTTVRVLRSTALRILVLRERPTIWKRKSNR